MIKKWPIELVLAGGALHPQQASARFAASAPGSFAYHGKFHPHMKGAIAVLAPWESI